MRSKSGPGALCVGAQSGGDRRALTRSLCQAPALSVFWSGTLCVGPDAPCVGVPLLSRWLCLARARSSDPRVRLHLIHAVRGPSTQIRVSPIPSAGPKLQNARATHPAAGPQLRSACHPSSPARSFFQERNPKPYCLGDYNRIIHYSIA